MVDAKTIERVETRMVYAHDMLEAGFASEAARKKALDKLNNAYEILQVHVSALIANDIWNQIPGEGDQEARSEMFNKAELPFSLHHVREKHVMIFESYECGSIVKDMLELRAAIKDAHVAVVPKTDRIERKAAEVRQTIVQEMERRRARYIEELDIARMLGGKLNVTARSHYVIGHKGTKFVRSFFYLNGKLTALNTIIAVADQIERENKK